MRDVYIIDAARTPVGMRNGALSEFRPDDILGLLLDYLLNRRAGVDPSVVEDLVCGCVTQIGEQGLNVARSALLAGGLPPSLPGTTVNRHEGSGLQAMAFAAHAVAAGAADAVIACGVESMSRQPMGADGFGDHVAHLGTALSPLLFERFGDILPQGLAAELAAENLGLTRSELDAWAARSRDLAASAAASGLFDAEIMPVEVTPPGGRTLQLKVDEGVGEGLPEGELASLAPAFKPDGVVTYGNSGGDADGAAALIVMEAEACSRLELTPRARYVCGAVSGCDPASIHKGPIGATARALKKAGLTTGDIDFFEINECYAPVVLAWMREVAPPRPDRVNACGGAIASGNPLGAAGLKLTCTLLSSLERTDGRFGLVATCAGMGMGAAAIIERIA